MDCWFGIFFFVCFSLRFKLDNEELRGILVDQRDNTRADLRRRRRRCWVLIGGAVVEASRFPPCFVSFRQTNTRSSVITFAAVRRKFVAPSQTQTVAAVPQQAAVRPVMRFVCMRVRVRVRC